MAESLLPTFFGTPAGSLKPSNEELLKRAWARLEEMDKLLLLMAQRCIVLRKAIQEVKDKLQANQNRSITRIASRTWSSDLFVPSHTLRAAFTSREMFESALTTVSFAFVDHHEYFDFDVLGLCFCPSDQILDDLEYHTWGLISAGGRYYFALSLAIAFAQTITALTTIAGVMYMLSASSPERVYTETLREDLHHVQAFLLLDRSRNTLAQLANIRRMHRVKAGVNRHLDSMEDLVEEFGSLPLCLRDEYLVRAIDNALDNSLALHLRVKAWNFEEGEVVAGDVVKGAEDYLKKCVEVVDDIREAIMNRLMSRLVCLYRLQGHDVVVVVVVVVVVDPWLFPTAMCEPRHVQDMRGVLAGQHDLGPSH
ncbi:hypothetical protein KCU62_g7017, partial [Aureobasidium sp. EXF-3399]